MVASAAASVPEAPSEICISQASIIMGIKDLLKELRSITTVRHLSEYKGLRAGVDIMCWIHKGIHRCIDELINGEETDAYVTYCMELISLLKQHEIFPYIVLDGRKLQAKREKNLERKQYRDENRIAAHEALQNGNIELANSLFKKSVGVTSNMIYKLIRRLREEKIKFIVSPYEADAQLAYFSMNGIVDLIITEDSDAIVYGCSRILFKLNRDTLSGDEIVRRNMGDVKGLCFANWTDDQFKLFACLAGSDYQNKLPNMGIKTAYRYAKDCKTYDGICNALQKSKFARYTTNEFLIGLKQAWLTFKHQLVYDEVTRKCVYLTAVPQDKVDEVKGMFCGEWMHQDTLQKLIKGLLNPHTLCPFEHASGEELSPEVSNGAVGINNESYQAFEYFMRNGMTNNEKIEMSSDSFSNVGTRKKRHFSWASNRLSCNPELLGVIESSKIAGRYQQIQIPQEENTFCDDDDDDDDSRTINRNDGKRAPVLYSNGIVKKATAEFHLDQSGGMNGSAEIDVISSLPKKNFAMRITLITFQVLVFLERKLV